MRRQKRELSTAIIIVFFFISWAIPVSSASLDIQKKPYLSYKNDSLFIRLEAKKLKDPQLEWRSGRNQGSLSLQRDHHRFWTVALDNIKSSKNLSYRIREGRDASEWTRVTFSPKPSGPYTFVVYGDNREGWGDSSVHRALLKQMKKENPLFVIHTGDMVADGNNRDEWNDFLNDGHFLFGEVPFQPSSSCSNNSP